MDKASVIMDIYTKYKKIINKHTVYISNDNIEKEIHKLNRKYSLDSSYKLHDPRYELKKTIEKKIKNIATYNINEDNISEEEVAKIEYYNQEIGEIVQSSVFIDISKQLYLEKHLLKNELTLHINIIYTLWAHLGNGYYFDIKDTDWDSLFDYSIDLFYINPFLQSTVAKDLNVLIRAAKYLKDKGIEFNIIEGKVILEDKSHLLVHSLLENMISNAGGLNVLLKLFNEELQPKYNLKLDRYLIHRNKSTTGENSKNIRVPYNYLINICGKNLDSGLKVFTIKGSNDIYKKIIQLSSYYLTVLELQGFSVFEDIIVNYKDIPRYISNNIIFENLYIPVQYNPTYILEILNNLYRSIFYKSKYKEFTFDEYYKVASVILKEYASCSRVTMNELITKTGIRKTILSRILIEISQSKDNINSDFTEILTPTNLFDKPLAFLKEDIYFLVSPYFCGYSFITVMHEILKRLKVPILNRELGMILEEYVKKELENKNFKYHSGHYSISNPNTRGECDIVLETNKEIIFLEVKKRGLPDTFKLGDDVEVLKSLGEGMLHAQKQILKHRVFLQKNGYMDIYKEQNESSPYTTLSWNSRRILSISICLPEYGFLTNKTISSIFLESLIFATYHARDQNQEYKLSKLNKLREQTMGLVEELREEDRKNAHIVFFNTLFRSVQQFLYVLKLSNDIDELIDYLSEEIYVTYGSLDFYTTLL